MERDKPILEYVTLVIIILVVIGVFFQIKNQEINFCRKVFTELAKGAPRAEKFIAWENLKAVGADIGAAYRNLPDEKERAHYREAFIKNFALGFRQNRGKVSAFKHWRLYSREGEKVVVAADYLGYNKTILFGLSKRGKSKLISLQWK